VPLPAVSAGSQVLFASQNTAYILQPGETAESVAQKFALTMEDIRQANAHRDTPVEQLGAGDSIELPLRQNPDVSEQDTRVAQAASDMGRILSAKDVQQSALSRGAGYLSQTVENWLEGSGGKARVKLSLDKHFSQEGNEFDFLYPWYDTPELMTFSQTGIRRVDNRTTLNLGAGQRWFTPSGMLGYNAFFDYDLTRYHYRLGAGVEYARDYLRLGGNGYLGLSKWREAPELTDYEAKPAHGFDLQAQYWLPSLPQLGGKVGYEQYFGKEVALFGVNSRQRNPFALTTGLDYTPFPLLTLSAEHRQGGSGKNDTRLGLGMNYQLGMPWRQQVDPGKVTGSRLLENRRYDLVERNNQIVLQYRKMEVITLSMPASVEGQSGETVTLTPKIFARHGVASLELDDSALVAAGGKVVSQGQGWALTLPVFRPGEKNSYVVSAVAVDKNGNRSERASTVVYVHMTASPSISHSVDKDGALADGKDVNRLTFYFRDAAGNALAGQGVTVKASHGQLMQAAGFSGGGLHTDAEGNLVVHISATRAEPSQVSATMLNSTLSGTVNFVADGTTLLPDNLNVSRDGALADGSDRNVIEALVTDRENNPVAGHTVSFSVSEGAKLVKEQVNSDEKGIARAEVTSLQAKRHHVTAEVNGSRASHELTFNADVRTATFAAEGMVLIEDGSPANGIRKNIALVKVVDANNNPLEDITVAFIAPADVTLAQLSVKTDSQGIARVAHTSLKPAQYMLSAALKNQRVSAESTFIPDAFSAVVATVTANKTSVLADDIEEVIYIATVMDSAGTPLRNVPLVWKTSLNQLSGENIVTDGSGTAQVKLKGRKAGTANVAARLRESTGWVSAPPVQFLAGAVNSGKSLMTLQPQAIINDGKETSQLNIALRDRYGNPVTGKADELRLSHDAPNPTWVRFGAVKESAAGQYETTVASTAAPGNVNLTVRYDSGSSLTLPLGVILSDKFAVNFTPPTANKPQALADGREGVKFTVNVTRSGSPAGWMKVRWGSTLGALSEPVTTTDARGNAEIILTSRETGSARVSIQIGDAQAIWGDSVEFVAGTVSPESDVLLPRTEILANAQDSTALRIHLQDASGHALEGLEGQIAVKAESVVGAVPEFMPFIVTALGKGEYQVMLQSKQVGKARMAVQVRGVTLVQKPEISVRADSNLLRLRGAITASTSVSPVNRWVEYCAVLETESGQLAGATVPVYWLTTSESGTRVSAGMTLTDANSKACVNMTRTLAGKGSVTARVGEKEFTGPETLFNAGVVKEIKPGSTQRYSATVAKIGSVTKISHINE
jgi:adhesin/invasin